MEYAIFTRKEEESEERLLRDYYPVTLAAKGGLKMGNAIAIASLITLAFFLFSPRNFIYSLCGVAIAFVLHSMWGCYRRRRKPFEQKLVTDLERIKNLYLIVKPHKFEQAECIYERYKGKMPQLTKRFSELYGVTIGEVHPKNRPLLSVLAFYYSRHAPDDLIEALEVANEPNIEVAGFFRELEREFGCHPLRCRCSRTLEQMLTCYYRHVDPAKAPDAPAILQEFAGREGELWRLLNERYGRSPMDTPLFVREDVPAGIALPASLIVEEVAGAKKTERGSGYYGID